MPAHRHDNLTSAYKLYDYIDIDYFCAAGVCVVAVMISAC